MPTRPHRKQRILAHPISKHWVNRSDVCRIKCDVDDVEGMSLLIGMFLITAYHEHIPQLDRQGFGTYHHQPCATGDHHNFPELMVVFGELRMLGGMYKRKRRAVAFWQIRPAEQAQPRLTLQLVLGFLGGTHERLRFEAGDKDEKILDVS
jgi:hypothetical protein